MLLFRILCSLGGIWVLASPALAQTPATQEQKPAVEELMRRMMRSSGARKKVTSHQRTATSSR